MITPTEIVLRRRENLLHITFDDGRTARLTAEYLRVESPSAEVQGHNPDQKQLVAGKREVGISAIEPTGNYAIRLIFSDGHETGIFSWDYLYRLGLEYDQRWADYLGRLQAAGLKRD
jgi:DUF971 family protein